MKVFKPFISLLLAVTFGVTAIVGQSSHFDIAGMDTKTSACADFYQYANGGWLTANPIPAVDLVHRSTTSSVSVTHYGFDQTLAPVGFPQMTVLDPVFRTLGTSWVFDGNARTLFSTDSFCGDLLETSSESVIRRSLDGAPDPQQLRRQTLAKFDWLARAETDLLRARWDRLFAEVEPLALAPIHGRPAAGQTVVASMLKRYRDAIFGSELA